MTKQGQVITTWLMIFMVAVFVTACGGGGDAAAPAPANTPSANGSYTIGGSVTGLVGSVVLQDNGGDNLSVAANGNFTFATALAGGSAYNATVLTQPAGQTCAIANGSGNATANVSNVAVTCTNNANNTNNTFPNRYTGAFTDTTVVTGLTNTGASGTVTFLRDDAACTSAGVSAPNTACYRVESVAYTFTTPTLMGCTVTPATYAVSLTNTPLIDSYLRVDLTATTDPVSGTSAYNYLLIAGWNPPSYSTTITCPGISYTSNSTPFAALASTPGTTSPGLQLISGNSTVGAGGGTRTYTWSLNAAP